MYNNVLLDIKFPLVVYKKLLGYDVDIHDLQDLDPELYKSI